MSSQLDPSDRTTGSRRNWLLRSLQAAIAATLAAVLYPVLRFLRPRPVAASGPDQAVAPFRVNQLPNAPGNPFNFGGKPCLVVLTLEGMRRLAARQPLRPNEDIKAFKAVCTHLDCTVQYRPEKPDIFCNCHNGVYDLNGRNVSGPPPRPLEQYHVTLRGKLGEEEIIVSRQA